MSTFMDTRKELALKLSTVPGLSGYERAPTTLRQGDAWALWGGSVNSGVLFDAVWRVIVFLGGDVDAAITFLDDTLPLLTEALEDLVYVESAFPASVPINGTDTHVVELRARSE